MRNAGSLALVLAALVPGVTVGQMCALGNESIKKIAGTVYNKGKVPKGIAFPTCVSVNAIACHLCPLESDPEHKLELKAGDCVRVEMGAHVDGYIAHVCTTVVVGAEKVG